MWNVLTRLFAHWRPMRARDALDRRDFRRYLACDLPNCCHGRRDTEAQRERARGQHLPWA